MSITLNSSATNNADWDTNCEFKASYDGGETFGLIDFTGAEIKVEVRDIDGCSRIVGTTLNGKITILDLGVFNILIPASEMNCLRPGSYNAGGVYSINGSIIDLFEGTLTVRGGPRL